MPVAEARVSVAVSTAVFGVRPDPHGVPRLCVALVPRMREPFLDLSLIHISEPTRPY